MGRTKNTGASKGLLKKNETNNSAKQPSVTDLVKKAQSLMGEMDLELARRFVDRILELEPQNFEAREMLGIIEVEEGNIPTAREVRSVNPTFERKGGIKD